MKLLIIGSAAIALVQITAASAQECSDPWEKVSGTYKCEGSCNYTASVCAQSDYTVGVRRWQFRKEGVSTTGVQVVTGGKSISFATKPGWDFRTANTQNCAATIKFDGTPAGVEWKRVSEGPANCGGGGRRASRQRMRRR